MEMNKALNLRHALCTGRFIVYLPLVLFFSFFFVSPVLTDTLPPAKQNANLKELMIVRKKRIVGSPERTEVMAHFIVETAGDAESLRKGLSGREGMPEDHGMLFLINKENSFWMNGMKFPLDILFFDRDMRLIEIRHNLQPCDACMPFDPEYPSAYALEINAGIAKKLGLRIGDGFVIKSAGHGARGAGLD